MLTYNPKNDFLIKRNNNKIMSDIHKDSNETIEYNEDNKRIRILKTNDFEEWYVYNEEEQLIYYKLLHYHVSEKVEKRYVHNKDGGVSRYQSINNGEWTAIK